MMRGAPPSRDGLVPVAKLMRASPEQLLGPAASPRERRRLVLRLQASAGNAAVNRLLRDVAPPDAISTGPALEGETASVATPPTVVRLVADTATPSVAQMRVSEFAAQLQRLLCAIADASLGPMAQRCPWVEHWIDAYKHREPSEIEAVITQYAPAAASAQTATELIGAVADRMRQGIADWQAGQLAGSGPAPVAAAPQISAKRADGAEPAAGSGGAPEPATMLARIGPGRRLDAGVAHRMGTALGADFTRVRLHDDTAGGAAATDIGARAFAVGSHIAFAPDQYAPGTLLGDALIAHELSHVMQQSRGAQIGGDAPVGVLERAADAAAAGATALLHGGLTPRGIRAAARSGLRLQRCNTPAPAGGVTPPGPAPPKASGAPDQHANLGEISTATLGLIKGEMFPGLVVPSTTGAPPVMKDWDGRTGKPDAAARRAELQTAMTAGMTKYLNSVMPDINKAKAAPKTPVVTLEGAGQAAKDRVDAVFGTYTKAAALTPGQYSAHTTFAMTSGKGLIDRTDPAQFTTDPNDLANWLSQTAPDSSAAAEKHAFSKDNTTEEATWLQTAVIDPFVKARKADLDAFDRYGFFDTTRTRISLLPQLGAGSQAPGTGGAPSEALRRTQWSTWQLLTHEYIHSLEHPAFQDARGGNRVLFEGFCEYFAMQVKKKWVPIAKADSDQSLRKQVEGTDAAGKAWPGFKADWVDTPDPGDYRDYVKHTEKIRDLIGPSGEESLRAAFFQGHIEMIGLDPSGTARTAAVHLADDVQVPTGINDRATLAAVSGVAEADIVKDNPGLPATGITAGTKVVLKGCRTHILAAASPTFDIPTGSTTKETADQIAAQNGITIAALNAANPNLSTASVGAPILIPKH